LSVDYDGLGHGGADIDAGEERSGSKIIHGGLRLPQPSVSTNASTLVLMGASDLSL